MKNLMPNVLKLEELAQFLLSIFMFSQLSYSGWLYPALILLPDVSMLGYLFGTKAGALLYNIFHHKFVAIAILLVGFWLQIDVLILAGVILFGHSAMDRLFGYGLKHEDSFKHTHLGWIGKK
ncbi:DUF4260 domain-containing protein [Sphingobacterium sp. lm-10]|uniref:DUF4260 domain-containing protein n=1 Tax=Sphingobacterium sp. lm-10 TaxID=2944904 RepID=UPI0020214E7D|nr:DUF4260 domain-containing protein [Sphingobacterium sp. lm-10]MCL7987604.1 DUF4260 domain-containing protein [Sphingobacterium sp. lm-10]